jgi:5'(3')-deoxyribonucleotidase
MKSKRIEVSFDAHNHQLENTKLEKITNQLNEALKIVSSITDSTVKSINSKQVADYLNTQTRFKNANMSADALNVKDEYETIKEAEKLLNKSEFIIFDKTHFKVNTDALKEHYTVYLSEQATRQYNALNEACNVLKEYNPILLQTINTNWSINLQKLSNISNYLRSGR